MKPILELAAFDPGSGRTFEKSLQASLDRRAKLFGSASVLFYEQPLEFVRGEGCWLYDAKGTPYLDAYNNVPSVGHCHPEVVAAASRQLSRLNIHNRYLHGGVMDYAEALLGTLPRALSNVTFTCTGSESNDLAVRMAAHMSGGTGVIVSESAYHGNTATLSDLSPSSFVQAKLPPHVLTVPAPDARSSGNTVLADRFAGHVAAAIAEFTRRGIVFSALLVDSIFSSDGVFADPPGFLQAAVEVVHRAGGILIADEVQAGFGRTGTSMWGFERHSIAPDIVTMGKPMGNGYPVGAVITSPKVLDTFCAEVGYFNTFGGSPVAAAVGLAVLEVIERERLMQNAAIVGGHLKQRLLELRKRHPSIADVRGAGLYLGVEMHPGDDATPAPLLVKTLINGMRDRRVLIGAAGHLGQALKIRPPLCFSKADADQLVAALEETLKDAAAIT